MFVHGFVNGPDFGEISIAFPGFRPPYWISGATQDTIFMAFCSPAITRKSHQTVSLYSKRFGNAIEKIGLGGKFTPPNGNRRVKLKEQNTEQCVSTRLV